jgi:hypothetical protein
MDPGGRESKRINLIRRFRNARKGGKAGEYLKEEEERIIASGITTL